MPDNDATPERAQTPLAEAVTAAESPPKLDLSALAIGPGDQIGAYHLIRVLGEGGFGIVFEAERRDSIVHRVALKVLKPGMDSRAVLSRFAHERQTLARLDHPNLARIFDAGTTPRGLPYFVMELVRGRTICDFADHQRLSVRSRLELLIPVCEAVHHAHIRGVLHRDLKPSNIIVAEHEGTFTPKVIDFGIAKALGDPGEETVATLLGQAVGTPEYMSPEQAMGRADVDTRSDVYSLGVVLYELIAGMLPFDSRTLRSAGYEGLIRIIREQPPPRPSFILRTADAIAIAIRRSTDPERLRRELRRELEWIPLKALSKEPARRYDSAQQLADDLSAYLQGRSLRAGPDSSAYRSRKFIQRNRLAVAGGTGIALALLLGLVGTSVGLHRETLARESESRARAKAEERLRDVRRMANTLLSDIHAEIERIPGATSARQKLITTALPYLDRLAAEEQRDPDLLTEIALGYYRLADLEGSSRAGNLGDLRGALVHHTKALSMRRTVREMRPGVEAEMDLINSLVATAHASLRQARTDDANALSTEALTAARSLTQNSPALASRYLLSRAIGARSWTLYRLGRRDEYEKITIEGIALDESIARDDPTNWHARSNIATGRCDLADLYDDQGRYEESLRQEELALDIYSGLHASDPRNSEHILSLSIQHRRHSKALLQLSRPSEAEISAHASVDLARGLVRDDDTNAAAWEALRRALRTLADTFTAVGREGVAVPLRREAAAISKRFANTQTSNLKDLENHSIALGELAQSLVAIDQITEAETTFRESLELDRRIFATEPTPRRRWFVAISLGQLADLLSDTGRDSEAEPLLLEALDITDALHRDHPETASFRSTLPSALFRLARWHRRNASPALAVMLFERCEALDVAASPSGPTGSSLADVFGTRSSLALALSLNAEHARAVPLIQACVEFYRAQPPSADNRILLAETLYEQALIRRNAGCSLDDCDNGVFPPLQESTDLFGTPELARLLSARQRQRAAEALQLLLELDTSSASGRSH